MESGKVIEQNVHTRDEGNMAASPCVDVIIPPSDGEAREALEPRARPRAEMRRRKSSLNKLFSGDTLIRDDRLEDTPRLSPPLVSPSRISLLPDSS